MAGQVSYFRGHNGGAPTLTPAGTITYTMLEGSGIVGWTTVVDRWQSVIPIGGTLDHLLIKVDTSPGVAKSLLFSLNVNGSDTALAALVTNSTSGSDTTHSVAVNAGDLVCLSANPTGSPTAPGHSRWVLRFTANATGQSLVLSGSAGAPPANSTTYLPLQGEGTFNNVLAFAPSILPTAGTFKRAFIHQQLAAGVGKTTTYTLIVNGVASALTCSLANTTTASDVTHFAAVNAGDLVMWQVVTQSGATPSAAGIGMEFDPAIEGESLAMATTNGILEINGTVFARMTGVLSAASQDAFINELTIATTLKKLTVWVAATLPNTKTEKFTLRKNGADTALTATAIGDGVNIITASDSTDSITVADNDLVDISIIPSVGSGTNNVAFSMVIYQPTRATPTGQVSYIMGRNSATPAKTPDGTLNYSFLAANGQNTWTATVGDVQQVIPVSGTFDYLRVKTSSSIGQLGFGHTFLFSLNVNGLDTALAAIINGGFTGTDTTHSVAVNAGDLVSISTNPTSLPGNTSDIRWVVRFTAQFPGQSLVLAGTSIAQSGGLTYNFPVQGLGPSGVAAVGVMPTAGTFKNLFAHQQTANGVGKATTYTLMVNNVASVLTCTLNNTTSANDVIHSVAVAAGDLVSWQVIIQAGATISRWGLGVQFDPIIEGESILIISAASLPNGWFPFLAGESGSPTETSADNLMIATSLRKLYYSIAGPLTNGETFTITLRKNAVPTTLALTATGDGVSTITGNDTATAINIADDDLVSYQIVDPIVTNSIKGTFGLVIYQPTTVNPVPDSNFLMMGV